LNLYLIAFLIFTLSFLLQRESKSSYIYLKMIEEEWRKISMRTIRILAVQCDHCTLSVATFVALCFKSFRDLKNEIVVWRVYEHLYITWCDLQFESMFIIFQVSHFVLLFFFWRDFVLLFILWFVYFFNLVDNTLHNNKQVQGTDRLVVTNIAKQLGLEGSYVPRTYIEQIQLEKLVMVWNILVC